MPSRRPERRADELDPVPNGDALDQLDVELCRGRQPWDLRGTAGLAEEVLDSARQRERQDPRDSLADRAEGVRDAARQEREGSGTSLVAFAPAHDLELAVEHVERLVLVV